MARRHEYEQIIDGVAYQPALRNSFEQCCDCGLVHRVHYTPIDRDGKPIPHARVRRTVWRAPTHTAGARRTKK